MAQRCACTAWLLSLLLWADVSLLFVSAKPKAVITTLDAKWPSTSLVLEASEYLASESSDLFWKFIENLPDITHLKEKAQYDSIFSTLSSVAKLSHHELQLLKFSLSLRQFAPSVQLHHELAREKNASGCPAFVDIHGKIACHPSEVVNLIQQADQGTASVTFKFDHRYPASRDGITAILYAHAGTSTFHAFHEVLKNLFVTRGIATYVLRHYGPTDTSLKPLRLSGYGVEMAIKSTEYKAKDDTKVTGSDLGSDDDLEGEVGGFNFTRLRDRFPKLRKELQQLKAHLSISSYELSPLKVWEFQDLSLQAAQNALTTQSLEVLRDVSQNFPSLAKSLVKTPVESKLRTTLSVNQKYVEAMHLHPGDAALYINGMHIDLDSTDAFMLLDVLRAESKLMDALNSLGLSDEKIQQMLRTASSQAEKGEFALDIRDPAVVYINDLELDPAYRHWPRSLQSLLQPAYPGMMRHIAKNIINMVLIVDPANKESIVLLKMAYAFSVNQVPIRIGIVPAAETEEGIALVKFFSYIHDEISAGDAMEFWYHLFNTVDSDKLTKDAVVAYFRRQHPRADYSDILESEEYDEPRKAALDFHIRSGLPRKLPQALVNGARLSDDMLAEDTFEDGVVRAVLQATSEVQAAVYRGQLHDGMDAFEWIMTRPNVVPRLNARVLTESTRYANFFDSVSRESVGTFLSKMEYITKKDDDIARPLTLWVIADLETSAGRLLYYDAIKHVKSNGAVRLAVIHSGDVAQESKLSIAKAVGAAMATLNPSEARSFVTKLVKEEFAANLLDGSKDFRDLEVHGMDTTAFLKAYEDRDGSLASHLAFQRTYVTESLGLPRGALALVCNGLIIGPLESGEAFTADDVALLTKVTLSKGAEEVMSMLGHALEAGAGKADPKKVSDYTMTASAVIASSPSANKLRKRNHFQSIENGVLRIPSASPDLPSFEVLAILDPLTRAAQKLTDYLVLLQKVVNADIKVVMNCREKISDMPLKNFYRYVADPEVTFLDDGSRSLGPVATFDHLPQKSILTLNVHAPDSWLVESVRTPFDLDNILLSEVSVDILAEFELEHLLVEGHCYDAFSGQPPRGLQFVMGNGQLSTDTIVMANLGYFQLKANPGVWRLELREGRSRDIYDVVSHENTDSPSSSSDVIAVINSFNAKILRLKVKKRPERINDDVLGGDNDESDEQASLWNSITSSFTGTATAAVKDEDKDNTLNIFSLASGHLYERFLRIMMLRVVRTTQSKVKFWLLKNYLSPTFKQFIPHMAAEYGFEYELVQYKWPRWLNQQTEKQRVMWGYKILFLDVLFPLDVKKIIFVDADQIVLGDLQELYDFDLEGAPYGYTPFCDSRKEMDGFRFWRSGYWASHLGGRPYHISALYVVDLNKFRKIAAGDRLRGQYQGLSQDPNSLSNLDQDLPNNMIHQVRIKSLPQEWLWCETWCDDDSKKKAKTIDLCNNPLTKEPKLQAAQRIVPEWPTYDNEIKALFERVYGTNGTTSSSSAVPEKTVPVTPAKGGKSAKEEL